ncbi:LysR family transcriptional regulator [Lentibacillus daqui]|uniref:LysR family transcriptional regulator n=1 Tax=Lentibacillus daqui TaxID=2911514 RepID=UPI0022B1E526|nr:LysR family transcriptional regulator [Lentibacillus daqui]
MEIKHLQYFLEVIHTRSFTHAAENLYITQPALSRIIKSLENEIGTPLFIRSRKELIVTDGGWVLYKYAKEMEKQFRDLQTELGNLQTLKKGHIRIGLPTVTNSSFFSQLIGSFHHEYPEVTFQLEEDGSRRIEEKVMYDQLDFGVMVLPTKNDGIDYFTFVNESLNVVMPSSHPLSEASEISLEKLKDETFILFNQDFSLRNVVLEACQEAGFEPKVISETSQLDFIEDMVASGLGITLLPESTSMELTSEIQTIPVTDPTIDWNLAIIWKGDNYLPQINKEFIRFAKEKLTIDD